MFSFGKRLIFLKRSTFFDQLDLNQFENFQTGINSEEIGLRYGPYFKPKIYIYTSR